jgi:hypothetical protein
LPVATLRFIATASTAFCFIIDSLRPTLGVANASHAVTHAARNAVPSAEAARSLSCSASVGAVRFHVAKQATPLPRLAPRRCPLQKMRIAASTSATRTEPMKHLVPDEENFLPEHPV